MIPVFPRRFVGGANLKNIAGAASAALLALAAIFLVRHAAVATTNIDATNRWAWNDSIGWIDFYGTGTVSVNSQYLQGYASSSDGDISLDCATTRNGNVCASSTYQVTNGDGQGSLTGWAWNDAVGWISFDCHNANTSSTCAQSNYEVLISPNTGIFTGYAWSDSAGWISFNCSNDGTCAQSNYELQSSWFSSSTQGTLDSTPFDTGIASGAQLNSVVWQGTQPSGTSVEFQFAVSNASSGPWNFIGSDGTGNTYYTTTGPGVSTKLGYSLFNNFRYFRYRVVLVSNAAQTLSPTVTAVIVNWSR